MNIHHYNGAYIDAAAARKMGLSHGSGKGTDAPRTRTDVNTSLPHNRYPGGKRYRKAQAKLAARINGRQHGNLKRPDRISSREDTTPWGNFGLTKPGAMKA